MFDVNNLDIVITRSCQLNCQGCLTFSNHNKVKGHVGSLTAIPWLMAWSKRIRPKQIHLFGGEPLMHPEFLPWVHNVYNAFCRNRVGSIIHVQTNGLKLSTLSDQDLRTLIFDLKVKFNISLHSNESWYLDIVNPQIERLTKCLDGEWTHNGSDSICRRTEGPYFRITKQTEMPWVPHYKGHGSTLLPGREWANDHYVKSHDYCEAKGYIQLVNGSLYKCPPMGVLSDTLKTYDYPNKPDWQEWLDYQSVSHDCSYSELDAWLTLQSQPERYCNMCFGPDRHEVKIHQLKTKQHE